MQICYQRESSWLDEWSNGVWAESFRLKKYFSDPRSPNMQKQLNMKVKYRESFRPFAPSILRENVNEWFEFTDDSVYDESSKSKK